MCVCVLCSGACDFPACYASVCLCLLVCDPMCVLLCAPGCVCLGGCLCTFVLCDVVGLRLCECLSDAACVWQHVGLWTGLA